MNTGLQMLYRKPLTVYVNVFSPFTTELWLFIVAAFILVRFFFKERLQIRGFIY